MSTITVTYTSSKDQPVDLNDAKKAFKGLRTVFDYSQKTQDKEIHKKLLELVKKKNKEVGAALFKAKYKVDGYGAEDKRSGEYKLKIVIDTETAATSKCWINKESTTAAKNELFKDAKGNKIKKGEEYYGGNANAPHVHVYDKGCHLKLGSKRFNLVQDGKKYSSGIDGAHDALLKHGKKDALAPWVAAALNHFGVSP
jgi:hypothetical protein